MAGSTPNLGLYLPGGGSTGTWVPDEVADVDPLNQNFQKIDVFAGTVGVQTSQNRQFYGPAGAIASVTGQKLGDEYQESDANKTLWRYDGSNWLTYELGLIKIRPTSVAGTGIVLNPDGTVAFGTTGGSLTVNGCFTSRFKRYKIVADWANPTGVGNSFHFCTGGTPDVAAVYHYQSLYGATASAIASFNTGVTFLFASVVNSVEHNIDLAVYNPADATKITKFNNQFMDINSGNGVGFLGGMYGTAKAFDGFRILAASGNFNGGELAIYGLA